MECKLRIANKFITLEFKKIHNTWDEIVQVD